jgi:hypothetical protein
MSQFVVAPRQKFAAFAFGVLSMANGAIALGCLVMVNWIVAKFPGLSGSEEFIYGPIVGLAYVVGIVSAALGFVFGLVACLLPDRRRALVVTILGIALSGVYFTLMPRPEPAPLAASPPVSPVTASTEEIAEAIPEGLYLIDFKEADKRLDANFACSIGVARSRGIAHGGLGPYLARTGMPELQAVAQRIAPEELAFLTSKGESTSDGDRASTYFGAITESMFDTRKPERVRLVAKTWAAYFQGLTAAGACPLDPDILRLIEKSP